uniref:Zinc finger protein 786 n=1 Tax=Neovison vison TaxID=452646 RepID=A0A8C7ABE3_NEOVI
MTFDDVALYFSEQEWEILEKWQKEMYQQVMKTNYETLDSLGGIFSKPNLITWIEQGRMLLIRDRGPLEKNMTFSPSTDEQWDLQKTGKLLYFDNGLPKPELISWIEQEREFFQNWREAQKSGTIICSSACLQFDPVIEGHQFGGGPQAVHSREAECCFQVDRGAGQCPSEASRGGGEDVSFRLDQSIALRNPPSRDAQAARPAAPRTLGLPGRQEASSWRATQHPCAECGESFWTKDHLEKHQRSHLKDQPWRSWKKRSGQADPQPRRSRSQAPRRFRCPDCGRSFRRKRPLLAHPAVHAGESALRDPECGTCFPPKQPLLGHRLPHEGERPSRCPRCDGSLRSGSGVQARQGPPGRERLGSWREGDGAFPVRAEPAAVPSGGRPSPREERCARMGAGERPFSCAECGKHFAARSKLAGHLRVHTGEKPFRCPECGKSFRQRGLLRGHQRVHRGERPFPCRKCGKAFAKQCKLTEHGRVHSGEKPFWCAQCGRSFRQRGQLLRHERLHSDERPFQCPECPLSFRLQSMLRAHRLRHGGERPFSCGECGRAFTHQCKLREHLRVHSGERPFQCPECAKSFRLKGILKAHQRTHSKERPFSCGECGKGFTRQSKLTEHFRVHSGERPFQCPTCDRSFRLKGQLLSHQRLHTGERPFQCPECGKSYRVKADMKAHQLLHSGEMPFSCECGKGFAKQSKLIEHIRTHTGEKPFQCPKCDKSFRLKAQLLSHQGLHTGERPFRCPECDKNFREKGHMLRHQRIHRPERPFACGDCGKGFIYKSKLAEHIRVHTKSYSAPNETDIKKRLSQLFAMIEADWS